MKRRIVRVLAILVVLLAVTVAPAPGPAVQEAEAGWTGITVCVFGVSRRPSVLIYGEPGHWGPYAAYVDNTGWGTWCGSQSLAQGYWTVTVGLLPWGCSRSTWEWQWLIGGTSRYYSVTC